MKLGEFMSVLGTYFDDKVIADDVTKRKNNATRLQIFLNAFASQGGESDQNPIYIRSDNFLRKVFTGIERLPIDCAQYYKGRLSSDEFVSFSNDLEDESLRNLIADFEKYGETVTWNDYADDVTRILENILDSIICVPETTSIRKVQFIGGNKIKIGSKTLTLADGLEPTNDIQTKELPYVDALLRVYSQDGRFLATTIEDLNKMNPRYVRHLKIQREFFFKAESVLHQIRDIFSDGEKEFNEVKAETLDGIQSTLLKAYKNALERVNTTMEHVVRISYGKSFLGRPNNGLIGNGEKQGIVHMLVNDRQVEWVVDYDENI